MNKLEEKSLKKINSSYILEKIFSFLHEKKKLDLIIYNKQIQKNLNIDIEVYRKKVENIKKVKKMEKLRYIH